MSSWLIRALRLIRFFTPVITCALLSNPSPAQTREQVLLDNSNAFRTPAFHGTPRNIVDAGAWPSESEIAGVALQMKLSSGQQKDLADLLVAQTTRSSTSYHKWLTPGEFATRFGPDEGSTSIVTAWLAGQGLKVTAAGRSGRFLNVSGTAAEMEAAFGVMFRRVIANNREFVTSSSAPSAPAEVAAQVEGVRGLIRAPHKPLSAPTSPAEDSETLTSYFATNHGIPALRRKGLDGAGISIGLLDAYSTAARGWLKAIAPSATVVTDDTGASGLVESITSESDWISRMSTLVEADAVQLLALPDLGCEADYSSAERLAAKALVEQASVEGISVIGEASRCVDGADFPAALELVTGVGKTGHYHQFSRSEVKPDWQNVTGMPSDGVRDMADISFRSPETDTSVPSAAFAAAAALLLQGLSLRGLVGEAIPSSVSQGQLNPVLYSLAAERGAFTKSVAGDELAYSTAEGLGDPNFAILLDAWPHAIVGTTPTTTQLTSSSYNTATGTSITLTATVTLSSATGTVTFTDAAVGSLGTATISSGVATLTLTTLSAGSHTIKATYGGDDTYAASSSATIGVYLTSDSTPVTGTLTASLSTSSISYGSAATLMAGVTLTSGTATGSVIATVNGMSYTGILSSGKVTLRIAALPPGTYSIVVACVTNAGYTCSSTSTLSVTVTGASSTTTLSPSALTTLAGSVITLTTTIVPETTALGAPTGTVTFYDTVGLVTAEIGVATVGTNGEYGGVASLSTTGLQAGSHAIVAVYSGSGKFLSSTSAAHALTVQDFAMTFSPSSLTLAEGSSGTVTGSVVPISGFGGTVSLSCTPPASSFSTCTMSSNTLGNVGTTVVSVTTTSTTSSIPGTLSLWWPAGVSLAGLLILPSVRGRKVPVWIAAVFIASLTCIATGCGSTVAGGAASTTSAGTPLGTSSYVITAAGKDGTLTARHSYLIQVTVQ